MHLEGAFTINLTPITVLILKKKLGLPFSVLKEIACSFAFGLFFAGMGFPLLIAILSHFFGINMSWSTTNKESSSRRETLKEVWRSCWVFFVCSLAQLLMIVLGWFFLGIRSWQAIVPMAVCASAHFIVPFIGI